MSFMNLGTGKLQFTFQDNSIIKLTEEQLTELITESEMFKKVEETNIKLEKELKRQRDTTHTQVNNAQIQVSQLQLAICSLNGGYKLLEQLKNDNYNISIDMEF